MEELRRSFDRRSGQVLGRFARAVLEPLRGDLFLQCVLLQALVQRPEIDRVQRLVLIEAGEHDRAFAGAHVAVHLQALAQISFIMHASAS